MDEEEEVAVGIKEIARTLSVSPETVYRMAQQQRIPGFKVGREWRFFLSEVIADLKAPRDPWMQSPRAMSRKRRSA